MTDADWLFREFDSPRELRACFLWECARELPYIFHWIDRLGAKASVAVRTAARTAIQQKLRALATDEFAKYFPGKWNAITALECAGFVEKQGRRAWQNLDPSDRANFINLLWPQALNVLRIKNGASVHRVAGELLSDLESVCAQPSLGTHLDPQAGLVVIELTPYSWTGFAKEDLIAEFTKILDDEEWAPVPPAERWKGEYRGFSEANIRTHLDELGIMRLIHSMSHGNLQCRIKDRLCAGIKLGDPSRKTGGRSTVFEQLVDSSGAVKPPGKWLKHRRTFIDQFRDLFHEEPVSARVFDGSWPTRRARS